MARAGDFAAGLVMCLLVCIGQVDIENDHIYVFRVKLATLETEDVS